jgi:hypothetical protein
MNNKLIAEFMGYTFVNGVYESPKDEFHIDEMLYDTSWDWLMPVVQKCFEGAHEDDFFEISGSLPDMESTYKSVVEFIKQHTITQNQDDE